MTQVLTTWPTLWEVAQILEASQWRETEELGPLPNETWPLDLQHHTIQVHLINLKVQVDDDLHRE